MMMAGCSRELEMHHNHARKNKKLSCCWQVVLSITRQSFWSNTTAVQRRVQKI